MTKRPPRLIVHTAEPGVGAGQHVAELVSALAAGGTETLLFCPSNFKYAAEVLASGAQIVFAPERDVEPASLGRRVFRNLAFAVAAAGRLWRTLRARDIVHFQFPVHLWVGLIWFYLARAKGAFVVWTVHDPLPHRWRLPKGLRFVETALLGITYSLCDRIIVHNQIGEQILVRGFQCDAKTVAVIPPGPLNAVSGTAVQNSECMSGSPTEVLRLLFFGSIRHNKGLHLAIEAIQKLNDETRVGTGRAARLTIAGSIQNASEQTYWDGCKRQIEKDSRDIRVINRIIDDGEIAELFAEHDAVLLPYGDFFSDSGVAMLALGQQKPIMATRAGGLGELMEESDCGVVIEEPSVEAVAATIEKTAVLTRDELKRKGLNGYRRVMTGRSWAVVASATQAVYGQIWQEQEKRVVIASRALNE